MKSPTSIRLFAMMVMEIAIWGAWQIKIFPYMGMLGFTPSQQAWVGSVFGIASVVGIFFSNQFADRNFSAERFLAFSHFVGGLALVATAFTTQFPAFFGIFLVYGLLYVPTLSVTNSLAFAHLKDPANEFGFVRMGGTVGWIVVSWPFIFLLGDRADAAQTRWVFIVAGLISFLLAGYSLTLPHTPPRKDAQGLDRFAWLRAARLLAVPHVLVLFIVILIDSVIHNGYFVVIDGFLTSVGISAKMTMVVSSIGQVAEIVAMLVLGAVLKRIGWKWTMIVGILGHGARYSVFAFFGTVDYQWLIIAIQVLHGICYAFFFATVYIYVDAVFPADVRSSAQGGANLLILGAGMVCASQLFPHLAARYTVQPATGGAAVVDYSRLFLVPTAMAIAGILLLLFFFIRPPRARGKRRERRPKPRPSPPFMPAKLRVLVVGCGHMGTAHARAYRRLESDFEIVGLVSRGAASRQKLNAEFGGRCAEFGEYFDALKQTRPDVVCISTYSETHVPYAVAAFEAGAHVFLEKPIADNIADAERLVATAQRCERKLVVGYILNVHPAWKKFTEVARTLGKPLVMRMNLNQQSSGPKWRTHQNLLRSTSPIVDCGVHYVDVMCRMTGSRPVKVNGIGARLSDDIVPGQINYGHLQVTFADGSVGWYEAGWGPMMSEMAFFVKDVIGPKGCVSIVAHKASGAGQSSNIDAHTRTEALRVHHAALDAEGKFARPDEIIAITDEPNHDELCLREQQILLRAIRENSDLSAHVQGALDSLRIVLAADQSFREGRTITL